MNEKFYISTKTGRSFRYRDLTGEVFGELTVQGEHFFPTKPHQRYWNCLCSCGKEKICRGTHLTQRKIVACGNNAIHRVVDPGQRFWEFVNKTESCWLWTGATNIQGYGNFCSSTRLAHRFSWLIHNGPIPDKLEVLHKCDIRLCVRPDHLFLGTQQDNVTDAIQKGRMRFNRRGKFLKLEQEKA